MLTFLRDHPLSVLSLSCPRRFPSPRFFSTPRLVSPRTRAIVTAFFLLSPFLPYRPSACIAALSKDRFNSNGDEDDDVDDVKRKNSCRSGPGMDFPFIFRIDSPGERKEALAFEGAEGKEEQEERMYEGAMRGRGPRPSSLHHPRPPSKTSLQNISVNK